MQQYIYTEETAVRANANFELEVNQFLRNWIFEHEGETLLQFDQSLEEYLLNDALRDFFLHAVHPLKELLQQKAIASHLGRDVHEVYFNQTSGDPLFSAVEQRIYNLAHRMDSEKMHIPFRSIHPWKQTEAGDNSDISTYPLESEQIRYNNGIILPAAPLMVMYLMRTVGGARLSQVET